jgi:hypothetical protein
MITGPEIDRMKSTDPKGPVVMFATPAYAGLHPLYVRSLLQSTRELCARGVRCSHTFTIHQSLIQNAREELFGQFLLSGADWMFMTDGDVGWEPTLPARMMALGEPVVAAPVPGRSLDLQAVAQGGRPADGLKFIALPKEELREKLASARRNVWHDPLLSGQDIEDRFFEMPLAVTTLFMMRRDAALHLCEQHPELKVRIGDTPSWALFHPLVEREMHWGEDASFFTRYRRAGGKIWIIGTATLSHSGPVTIEGQLATSVEQPEAAGRVVRSWPYEQATGSDDVPGR